MSLVMLIRAMQVPPSRSLSMKRGASPPTSPSCQPYLAKEIEAPASVGAPFAIISRYDRTKIPRTFTSPVFAVTITRSRHGARRSKLRSSFLY